MLKIKRCCKFLLKNNTHLSKKNILNFNLVFLEMYKTDATKIIFKALLFLCLDNLQFLF